MLGIHGYQVLVLPPVPVPLPSTHTIARSQLTHPSFTCGYLHVHFPYNGICSLTSEEGHQLAEVVRRCPRISSINVRSNDSMGPEAADVLCAVLKESGAKLSSVCGITPQLGKLEVPAPSCFVPEQGCVCVRRALPRLCV